jgi:ribosome-binding factor A
LPIKSTRAPQRGISKGKGLTLPSLRKLGKFLANVLTLERSVDALKDRAKSLEAEVQRLQRQVDERAGELKVLVIFVNSSLRDQIEGRAERAAIRVLDRLASMQCDEPQQAQIEKPPGKNVRKARSEKPMSRVHHQQGGEPSQRMLRVAELIRHTMAELLVRSAIGDPVLESKSITIPEVRMSPDLKLATIYVLPLGGKSIADVLAALDRHRKVLRGEIARRINLRFAPDIRFKADPSFDYGAKIDALLELPEVKRDLSKKQDKPE